MSDIAVIYASHYGFTEAYARWLAEELAADLLEAGKVKREDLERHGTIVYGGGLYAGGVNGISLLVKNAERIQGKRLYLFTWGPLTRWTRRTSPISGMALPKLCRRSCWNLCVFITCGAACAIPK